MKKLVLCVILIIFVLGLAACARGMNEVSMAPQAPQFSPELTRQALSYDEVRHFDLPLTGGSGWSPFGGRDASAPAATAAPTPRPGTAPGNGSVPPPGQYDWEDMAESDQRLIIQNASIELETENFREVESALRQLAPSVNGFIESDMLSTHGRPRYTIVMRVPAASFEEVLAQVASLAYVRFSNQWAQDVTDQFFDMAASYRIRRLEEERILALIEQAQTVQELLALEQRLSNTRLSIEIYLSQLNHMAGQVAYSTITVTLICVSEIPVYVTGPGLGERVGSAFGDSARGTLRAVQNFIVFFAGAIVPLTLIGIIAFGVYMVVRVRNKKMTAR